VRLPGIVLILGIAFILASVAVRPTRLFRSVRASESEPFGEFDPYLHRPQTGAPADPINLIFRNGTADEAANVALRVLGWTEVQGGGMTFIDADHARPTRWQIGADLGWGARYHMRIEDKGVEANYVLAGVHRDDTTGCGHIGHYFDEARDLVARAFVAAGYTVTYVRLHNTTPGIQCDGSKTAGDGVAAVVDLASSTPPAHSPALPVGHLLPRVNFGTAWW
jgi:hypothetical protein